MHAGSGKEAPDLQVGLRHALHPYQLECKTLPFHMPNPDQQHNATQVNASPLCETVGALNPASECQTLHASTKPCQPTLESS